MSARTSGAVRKGLDIGDEVFGRQPQLISHLSVAVSLQSCRGVYCLSSLGGALRGAIVRHARRCSEYQCHKALSTDIAPCHRYARSHQRSNTRSSVPTPVPQNTLDASYARLLVRPRLSYPSVLPYSTPSVCRPTSAAPHLIAAVDGRPHRARVAAIPHAVPSPRPPVDVDPAGIVASLPPR